MGNLIVRINTLQFQNSFQQQMYILTMAVLSLTFPLQNFAGGPGIPASSNWLMAFFLSLQNISLWILIQLKNKV